MFNSLLLNDYYEELRNAIWERQQQIVEYYYDLWLSCKDVGKDDFGECFQYLFPPGFIDRDKESAQKVIRDIWDIVQSPIIRHNVKAIYCYVMYHMIDAWFDEEYNQMNNMLPTEVKHFVSKLEEQEKIQQQESKNGFEDPNEKYDELSETDRIRNWFIDKDSCLGDFEDSYDEDYVDETIAEATAEEYLNDSNIAEYFNINIEELTDLLPNDLFDAVTVKIEKEKEEQQQIFDEAKKYAEAIWPQIEDYFHVLSHGDKGYVSSFQGTKNILLVFKDWVENNGGWRDIKEVRTTIKENAIHRWILLCAKTYLDDQNLDINCEGNIGPGQEDIKISRGKDKTVIEVKLASNPRCKHGFEIQLPRYAEAEHTENMVFCLIEDKNNNVISEIEKIRDIMKKEGKKTPELFVINALEQKSASVM